MIARELTEFFATFGHGRRAARRRGRARATPRAASSRTSTPPCCASAGRQVRFRDVAYAEDQAFARDAMAAGWRKAYVPDAGVLHAHDYPFARVHAPLLRRVPRPARDRSATSSRLAARAARHVARAGARRPRATCASTGCGPRPRWRGRLRSLRHHAGRAVFAALGSRADRLPAAPRAAPVARGPRRQAHRAAVPAAAEAAIPYAYVRALLHRARRRRWPPPRPHDASARPLHFAWVMPPFRRGSGGHMTLFTIARELEQRGSLVLDLGPRPRGRMHRRRAAVAHRELIEHFAPLRGGRVQRLRGLARRGRRVRDRLADRLPAVDAAGLQAEGLPRAGLRARLLSRVGGAPVGGGDLPHGLLRASPRARGWRELLRERYGATRRRVRARRRPRHLPAARACRATTDTVVFYARPSTPRRATELGLLALDELVRRRPGTARRAVRRHEAAARRRSRTSSRGVLDARLARAASTTRPPSASSSRSPTTRACRRR